MDLLQGDYRSAGPGSIAAPIAATLGDIVAVFAAEHLFLSLLALLPRVIPSVPGWVQVANRRREYRMKKALFDLRHPQPTGSVAPAAAPSGPAPAPPGPEVEPSLPHPRARLLSLAPVGRLKQMLGGRPSTDPTPAATPKPQQPAPPSTPAPAATAAVVADNDPASAALQAAVRVRRVRQLLSHALDATASPGPDKASS